jgi:hypothetical protein
MKINNNNYKEYLLLYIDNELTNEEVLLVEQFVDKNKLAATELELLLALKLPVEPVLFLNKNSLYKNLDSSITSKNYQEYFINYFDIELTVLETQEVDAFVLNNPSKQKEFEAIKTAKLLPIDIECPNKNSLYKKEKKRVAFYFKQISVAAILLIMAIGGWLIFNAKSTQKTSFVAAPKGINSSKKTLSNSNEKDSNLQSIPSNFVAKDNKQIVENIEPKSKAIAASIYTKPNNNIASNVAVKAKKIVATKPLKNFDIEQKMPSNSTANNATIAVVDIKQSAPILSNIANEPKKIVDPINNSVANSLVVAKNVATPVNNKTIVFKTLEEDETTNPVYIAGFELNNKKVSTLLKKAGKIFKRKKTAEDLDKNAVASI